MRSSCHSSYPTLLYVFFFSFLSLITETLPQCDITRGDTMTGHATSRLQDNWVVSVRPPASQSIAVPSFTSNFIFFSLIVYLCVFLLSSFFKKRTKFPLSFFSFFFHWLFFYVFIGPLTFVCRYLFRPCSHQLPRPFLFPISSEVPSSP